MEIFHSAVYDIREENDPALDALGIKYKITPFFEQNTIRFRISESDERWPHVQELMREKGLKDDSFDTYFSEDEILEADWLRVWSGIPQKGYPQPEKTWVTNPPNYGDDCPVCGTFRQIDSFSIKKEPRLGRYDFMGLYWTPAIFAVDRVFQALESNNIQGYERWPVHIYNEDKQSELIQQLYVPTIAEPGLLGCEELEPVLCSHCGELKYNRFHKRGIMYFCKESVPSGVDMFQTYEWFGEGHAPRRELFVSSRFAQLYYENSWKQILFKVVELV